MYNLSKQPICMYNGEYFSILSDNLDNLKCITCIMPPTSFNQLRRSIDVTWQHTSSPRYTQRQKSVTGIHWKCLLSANKGCWRDKFIIRYVTDVLRTQSRFIKYVGGLDCGLTPTNFTNPLLAGRTSETDLITNKRGGSLFYGGQYFSWRCVQMTLILRSKNDPHSRRIMTGGHYST